MDPDELGSDDDLLPEDDDPLHASGDTDDDALPPDEGDGDDEPLGDGDDDAGRQPQRQRRRGAQATIAELRAERRALREENERLKRGPAPQPVGQPQRTQADIDREAREEEERVALMSPAEVSRYYYDKGMRETRNALQLQQFNTADATDRMAFDALCRTDPLAKRLRSDVLARLEQERSRGNYAIGREAIYTFLLGERVRNRPPGRTQRQRRAGQESVERERVRPPASANRGAPSGQRPRMSEREARRQRLLTGDNGKPVSF